MSAVAHSLGILLTLEERVILGLEIAAVEFTEQIALLDLLTNFNMKGLDLGGEGGGDLDHVLTLDLTGNADIIGDIPLRNLRSLQKSGTHLCDGVRQRLAARHDAAADACQQDNDDHDSDPAFFLFLFSLFHIHSFPPDHRDC